MSNAKEIRATGPVLKALSLFLENHPSALSGADIINKRKVLSGTIYPALERLRAVGWLESYWEDVDPSTEGRPRKKFYRLTGSGLQNASILLTSHGISFSKITVEGES